PVGQFRKDERRHQSRYFHQIGRFLESQNAFETENRPMPEVERIADQSDIHEPGMAQNTPIDRSFASCRDDEQRSQRWDKTPPARVGLIATDKKNSSDECDRAKR